jgi:two-component system response regulator YesN
MENRLHRFHFAMDLGKKTERTGWKLTDSVCTSGFGMMKIRRIIEKNIQLLEQETQTDSGNIHREVEEVKHYINTHYGEEISIEMLAERVFLAPSYLSTIFKKETGQNLSKFIKICRMEKAREMLEGTKDKIVSISEKVGYPNVSYFCQSFREYYGMTPQKYRDQGENAEQDAEQDEEAVALG